MCVRSRLRVRLGLGATAAVALGWLAVAQAAGPLPPLAGPPLAGPTHLRLIVGGTPPFILDVDSRTISPVAGIVGGPGRQLVLGATPVPGGALAVVDRFCRGCGETAFLIRADGSVALLASGTDLLAARGSAAVWELAGQHGRCALALHPATHAAVPAPCGKLQADTDAGLLVSTARRVMFVDPLTGTIRASVSTGGRVALQPLHRELVLESSQPPDPTALTLVDLATGARRRLVWPSILHFNYHVVADPDGPLVAVWFDEPAYPGPAQAVDVWLLDTATGRFTHVPGFPAQEDIKFSGIAWTSDHRLVVVSESARARTVLGVWQPGAATLPLVPVPTRATGYVSFVPLLP